MILEGIEVDYYQLLLIRLILKKQNLSTIARTIT